MKDSISKNKVEQLRRTLDVTLRLPHTFLHIPVHIHTKRDLITEKEVKGEKGSDLLDITKPETVMAKRTHRTMESAP